jgi:hypothetical protein
MAVVLDHIDGIPQGILDYPVDRVRSSGNPHIRLYEGPNCGPATSIVGTEERAAEDGLFIQPLAEIPEGFFDFF